MKREKIPALVVLLFIASLFFPFAVALKVFTMGLLVLTAILYNAPAEKWVLLKERKYIWFMLAFAIIMLLSTIFSDNRADGFRAIQLRLPLFLFPISLGLIHITKVQRNKVLLGCSLIVTFSCLVSLVYAISRYAATSNTAWLYNDALSYFIGQQSIYTALLVNISIYVFAWHLFFTSATRVQKTWLATAIAFLFIISYLLASRNMMLILYTTTVIFTFYIILTKKKYREGLALLVGMIIAGTLILKFFPQTVNRFRELAFTQFNFQSQAKESHYADELTPEQWNGANFRLAAWQCGWELFKEHPVIGVGLGDKKDELLKIYEEKQFHFAIKTNKNVHNNYLDILFSMGVAALLLFLTGWIFLPAFAAIYNRDMLALLILITFTLAMVTENYFDRSIGAILFGFYICFMLTPMRSRKRHMT